MQLESLAIKNFKVLQNLHLKNIPPFAVFVGANGSGKSTLFDVFGFLCDSLNHNVRQALQKRGGFKEVVSRGHEEECISVELKLRMRLLDKDRLVTYLVEIGPDANGIPGVSREILRFKRQEFGAPYHFLDFSWGKGFAVFNEEDFDKLDENLDREHQDLESPSTLAIKGLGQFQRFRAASTIRALIENWHVSDFHISAAQGSVEAGFAEHLSTHGENLPLVAQYLYENHRAEFDNVLRTMERRIPGIKNVTASSTTDGRIVLKFQDGNFHDPFISRHVSDGTIKMFAYLLLLHDPTPHPLLCIEEPENQLYPSLLAELAEEFSSYSSNEAQVFVSTHSPDFLNGVELNSIFWLSKDKGFTNVYRAAEDENIVGLVNEGDLPGYLWKAGMFREADPVQ
ncbi:MAG TPA: chromosome segregation protein SMC [Rhodospirillales bacterium]|nr:chromosome segregation protein SMC [Rhodospirillales bacterium]